MEALQDIKHTIVLEAPIHKVWKKVSTSDGIASWFMENDIEAKEGHEFHLQSPFGPSPCKVIEVDEPQRLSFTWDTDGWVVSFRMNELDDKTEFTLIHSGWKSADSVSQKANEQNSVIRERMNHGWTEILKALHKVVEG
ncbi:SRPBCC family protein [Bacillus sp. FJAT-45350]|uniref:SRPBCC family protein n=1 Tax=Bacillus sp. FJAT-45350 TaxID=2011014 RepID=UPI000BB769D3|nr:SRPBCC domain-containing protein [Bacillus sp. FJAT-45350]